jgi:uncharacterized protein YfeS
MPCQARGVTPDDEDDLPTAHRAFRAHVDDPLYDDDADELAPFGSDEGWELVREWGERRDDLSRDATLQEVLDESPFPEAVAHLAEPEAGPGEVEVATA